MEQLPIDVKIEIVLAIDEFSSLWNLIRSCPSIYDAFAAARKSVLSSVLKRTLYPDMLCTALALHNAPSLTSRDYYDVAEFLRRWAGPGVYPSPDTRIFNGLARRQILVEWFARDLCDSFKTKCPDLWSSRPIHLDQLDSSEVIRIHRALYRFDLYSILFGRHPIHGEPEVEITDHEIRDLFLHHLPSWEIEEVACILSYIKRRSRDLKDSKIPWQQFLDWEEAYPNYFHDYIEDFCLLGLDFLHSFFAATAAEKKIILRARIREQCECDMFPLGVLLHSVIEFPTNEETPDFSDRVELLTCKGPGAGWIWAFKENEAVAKSRLIRKKMQERGYCLWSRKHVEALVKLNQSIGLSK